METFSLRCTSRQDHKRNLTNPVYRRNHERRRTDWSLTALTRTSRPALVDLIDGKKKKNETNRPKVSR